MASLKRAIRDLRRWRYNSSLDRSTESVVPTIRLGNWILVDDAELQGATIISAGLGEDASFDVEFAARYQAKIVIVDPTPSAIAHFDEIAKRIGLPADEPYQPPGGGGSVPQLTI